MMRDAEDLLDALTRLDVAIQDVTSIVQAGNLEPKAIAAAFWGLRELHKTLGAIIAKADELKN